MPTRAHSIEEKLSNNNKRRRYRGKMKEEALREERGKVGWIAQIRQRGKAGTLDRIKRSVGKRRKRAAAQGGKWSARMGEERLGKNE